MVIVFVLKISIELFFSIRVHVLKEVTFWTHVDKSGTTLHNPRRFQT